MLQQSTWTGLIQYGIAALIGAAAWIQFGLTYPKGLAPVVAALVAGYGYRRYRSLTERPEKEVAMAIVAGIVVIVVVPFYLVKKVIR